MPSVLTGVHRLTAVAAKIWRGGSEGRRPLRRALVDALRAVRLAALRTASPRFLPSWLGTARNSKQRPGRNYQVDWR